MKKLRSIAFLAGVLLLILSAASLYVAMGALSDLRPAEDYEDRGVLTFQPYEVYPVQVENTGAGGRDRRMHPTKTVYMVYYRAADGSGYKWSDEAYSRDHGRQVVETGEAVRRRVLGIPSDGTYITVEPEQTAESYTKGLREKYTQIVGMATLYIVFYIIVLFLSKLVRRLRKSRAEDGEPDRFHASGASPLERFSPEIAEPRSRRRGRLALFILLPVVLLLFVFWSIGRHSSDPVELDYGWSGNAWTCEELDLRFDLPAGGEIYDAEEHQTEREKEFGSRGSAGQTLLTAIDRSEGSTLNLLVVRTDPPREEFLLKMVTAYAGSAAGEGAYTLEAQEDLTVGGHAWRAWRIDLPEQSRVHYYLYRQSGEYALALTASSPMGEAPPAILACFRGENGIGLVQSNPYLPPVGEDGYFTATFPASLLGNMTPEELLADFQKDLEAAGEQGLTPDQLPNFRDLMVNEDCSVTYSFTEAQYRRSKETYYSWGLRILPEMFGLDPGEIVKSLEYAQVDGEGIPWAVIVRVDRAAFQGQGNFADFVTQLVPYTMIGRYQIMCGVPAGEWAVHVTAKDAETGEVLAERDFPMEK